MEALDWFYLPNLDVPTGVLAVADVRDGPGEHMVLVRLQPGTFRPCVGIPRGGSEDGTIAAFRTIHESILGGWRTRRTPDAVERGGVVGWLSTDVATAGLFDYDLLARLADRDPGAFEAWREGFFASMAFPHGFDNFGGDGRAPIVYVQSTVGGGHFPVSELLLDGEAVGVEVAFLPRIVDGVDTSRALTVERVGDREPLTGREVTVEVAPAVP